MKRMFSVALIAAMVMGTGCQRRKSYLTAVPTQNADISRITPEERAAAKFLIDGYRVRGRVANIR